MDDFVAQLFKVRTIEKIRSSALPSLIGRLDSASHSCSSLRADVVFPKNIVPPDVSMRYGSKHISSIVPSTLKSLADRGSIFHPRAIKSTFPISNILGYLLTNISPSIYRTERPLHASSAFSMKYGFALIAFW